MSLKTLTFTLTFPLLVDFLEEFRQELCLKKNFKIFFSEEEDIRRGVIFQEKDHLKRDFLRGRLNTRKEEFYLCRSLISISPINR